MTSYIGSVLVDVCHVGALLMYILTLFLRQSLVHLLVNKKILIWLVVDLWH